MFLSRLGNAEDIDGVLLLQEKNLVTNLNEEQKKNGFVTTPFTAAQLEELISRDGLFVLQDGPDIQGYVAAAGWDYFAGRPMFDTMIELFGSIEYKGTIISKDNSFQYGPICIDSRLRGTDAFPILFHEMRKEMSKRFLIGTTFINKLNERSYQAHIRKVNIDVINEFTFNNNNYYGLAFETSL